ncbi:plasmid pRiA4b ORF-3 family protein [Microbacterium sp. NPDC089987]|uniref:plasmid pRiA4b ORF-3 family protein n=1 Tax=Microbacterium sp. NPDC089987 TaxID=3364202 RepID=UPI0037F692EE
MTRYRLRVALVDSDPEIWREFDIEGQMPLRMLHIALQTIMGWRESHLHAFTDTDPDQPSTRGRRWESPDFADDNSALSEDAATVDQVLSSLDTLWYEYDFGDGWVHRLDVVERQPDAPLLAPVVLLDGANRGPFEDAGGIHGYRDKLAALADPQHPEHRDIADWVRATVGPWAPLSPGAFDLVGAQSELNLMFNPQGSGLSPYDMSGLVKSDELRRPGDVGDESPIVELAAQLPPPIRSELRQHLHLTGVLEPLEFDDETAARIVRPFAWLMDAVGPDGLALTDAGWMPPGTVLTGMTELGLLDDWIGTGNREELTPPISELRGAAQRLGLMRVQKGRLLLSAAAKKALGDPRGQLQLITRGVYRKLSDAESDAAALLLLAVADGTAPDERWHAIAFGLAQCGWQSSTRLAFTERDIAHATFHPQRVLDLLGDSLQRQHPASAADDLRLFARAALR